MNRNILRELIVNLDDYTRSIVLKYFNNIVYEKYSYFKENEEVYRNLINNDPFYNYEYNNYPNKAVNNDLYKISYKIFSINDAIKLIKTWVRGSCDELYYLDGFVQELVYSEQHVNKLKNDLLEDDRILIEYLKSSVILTINEEKLYYIIFIKPKNNQIEINNNDINNILKIKNNEIICITNLINGFLNN